MSYDAEWFKAHRDEINTYRRRRRAAEPEKVRALQRAQRKRARERERQEDALFRMAVL
jgi:hypothetical protein